MPIFKRPVENEYDKLPFDTFYEKYKNKAYYIAYKVLKNEQLAEDAAIEAFMRLSENFEKVRELQGKQLDYFVIITVKNTAINMLKSEMKHLNTEEYDDSNNFSEESFSQYDRIFLKECIKKLSDEDKDILYMRVSLGLGFREIAKALKISEPTARKRYQYAKDRLKKLLTEDWGYEKFK